MFDKNRFQAKYIEHGLSAVGVARIMGINPATLSRKVNGEYDFTRNEIQLFRVELGLTAEEVADIFLPELAFTQEKTK